MVDEPRTAQVGTKIDKIDVSLSNLDKSISDLSSFVYGLVGEAEPEEPTDPPVHDSFNGVYSVIETKINIGTERINGIRERLKELLLGSTTSD